MGQGARTDVEPDRREDDMATSAPVKVLYLGGYGRSGSTLVERVVGQLPGFRSVGELVFLWDRGLVENQLCGCGTPFRDCPFWRQVGEVAFGGWDAVDTDEMLRLRRATDRNRYIPLMAAPRVRAGYQADVERWTAALSRLYDAIRTVSGDRVVIDASKQASTAYLLRRVPGLDLRVVHLVRDSRGVAYSWTKQVRKPEVQSGEAYMPVHHPARSSARWVTYNLLFDAFAAFDRTLVLRYEAFLADPRAALEAILAHAGEAAADGELGFLGDGWVDLEPDHTVAGNPMRFKTGRLHLRLDQEWTEKMPEKHQKLVTAMTWPLQFRYGYRRTSPR